MSNQNSNQDKDQSQNSGTSKGNVASGVGAGKLQQSQQSNISQRDSSTSPSIGGRSSQNSADFDKDANLASGMDDDMDAINEDSDETISSDQSGVRTSQGQRQENRSGKEPNSNKQNH